MFHFSLPTINEVSLQSVTHKMTSFDLSLFQPSLIANRINQRDKMKKIKNGLLIFAIIASTSFYTIFALVLLQIPTTISKVWPGPTPTQNPEDAKLNKNLANLVLRYRQGEISVMDLSTVTPFEWDRVYIFARFQDFMDDKEIDRVLGNSWRQLKSCDYPLTTAILYVNSEVVYKGYYSLFVFMHKNRAVSCLFYVENSKAHVYTNSADAETGIAREDALFIIDKEHTIRPIEK